jgi:DNA replication licensing factor MCM7
LRFSSTVERADVDEALRLMEKSKATLDDDEGRDGEREDMNPISRIFRIIKDMFASRDEGPPGRRFGRGPGGERDNMDMDDEYDDESDVELRIADIRARIIQSGFTEDQLQNTLDEVSLRFPRFSD